MRTPHAGAAAVKLMEEGPERITHPDSRVARSPLIVIAGCYSLGIALARPGNPHAPDAAPLLLASVCLLAGLVTLRMQWQRLSFICLALGFVAAGASGSRLFNSRFPPNHARNLPSMTVDLKDPVRLEGIIVSTPSRTPYGLQFDMEVKRLESLGQVHLVRGKVRLRLQATENSEAAVFAEELKLQFGDTIRTLAKLRRPRRYQNPGSFDFRQWMESIEDIYWIGIIKSPLLIEKLPRSDLAEPAAFFERTRRRLLAGIDRLYPPWSREGRNSAVLKAVLFGDRSSLDSDIVENFRKTGLYHLLVIAGLHVGLLAMLTGLLLRWLRVPPYWRTILIFAFLCFYALLVEQRAPTLRATIMISAYLVGRLLYRDHSILNAIGLAGLALLLFRPAWLFESGFQLSFASALLIAGLAVPVLERTTEPYRRALWQLQNVDRDISLAPRQAEFRLDLRSLISWLNSKHGFLGAHPEMTDASVAAFLRALLWAANVVLFSAVLQLGLLLPMAQTFHRVTFAGIGMNALAIPIMTLVLAAAVPTVLVSVFAPGVAHWMNIFLAVPLSWLFALTDLPHLPNWLSYRVPEPPAWVGWGFASAALGTALALNRSRRALCGFAVVLSISGALISIHPFRPGLPKGMLELTALDCGGGDSLLVVLPDQTTLLVDAGGSRFRSTQAGTFQGRKWDPGEDIVSPYLWSRGIRKIDILALSHAHEDHIGGLPAVIRNFRIGEFWFGKEATTPAYRAVAELIRKQGIPCRQLVAGDTIMRGGAVIRILWPRRGSPFSADPSNDDSVVMRISQGDASMMLPGDVSRDVEANLIGLDVPLQSQVLKVAHHGAKSSSSPEFLSRVAPRIAVITGQGSDILNLPNPETLERLRICRARVLRTDIDGAVTVQMRAGWLSARGYAEVADERAQ
ncbi:MAG TPA: ComEC/Rec2 family competence protein [Terriglobia bacterium]|nr:ComEC/Rec2 family competence protein [Terriglobia bacterium]